MELREEKDFNRVSEWAEIVLDKRRELRCRIGALDQIADLAGELRRKHRFEKLLEALRSTPNFAERLFSLATGEVEPESLRRSAAWALSQLSDWPRIFNEKILDSPKKERVRPSVDIDPSLPYVLPRLRDTDESKQRWKTVSPGSAVELPSKEQVDLAERFLPHLDGRGFELRWDTIKFYLGHYFRVLQDSDDPSGRCVQYLFMWSKQVWPISAFFTAYFWPLLTVLSLFAWTAGFTVPLQVLGLALILYGTARTLLPSKERCFKNDTWYAVGGVLLLASLWDNSYARYVPLLAAAPLGILNYVGPVEHVMDYGPIFLYLKKENDDWRIDGVRYDKFHYETSADNFPRSSQKYVTGKTLQRYVDKEKNDTVFFTIDNVWRSFQLCTPHAQQSRLRYWGCVAAWVVTYSVAALLLLFRVYSGTNPPSLSDLHLLALALSAPVILVALNDLAVTPISDPSRPKVINRKYYEDPQKRVLTYNHLVHLWNMSDDKANLVIRKKLQDPFRPGIDLGFWRSFRDPSAERLAYEGLRRIRALERSLTSPQDATLEDPPSLVN